jgi:hypothetical protein
VHVGEAAAQARGRLAQDGVAAVAAEAGIDLVEPVEADVQERHLPVLAVRSGKGQPSVLAQQRPSRKAGERIVQHRGRPTLRASSPAARRSAAAP